MTTREFPFTDPVANRECTLVIPPAPPGGRVGVRHPGCGTLADVALDLDAFFCPACRWNGRVSGAWAVDMIKAAGAGDRDCL